MGQISLETSVCDVVLSASGQCGPDAVPLYEAGENKIKCVIAMEAMGQLSISKASKVPGESAPTTASYGAVTMLDYVIKKGVQAQSGQAYIVDSYTLLGRCQQE